MRDIMFGKLRFVGLCLGAWLLVSWGVGVGGCAKGSTSGGSDSCGNGVLEPALGEECDDGNHVSGDGCSADCRVESDVETVCNDAYDDDGDGLVDCADDDCDGQECGVGGRVCASHQCVCPGGDVETQCDDGQDNDCDGNADCLDPDCKGDPSCKGGAETSCSNGEDDDGDGDIDCDDGDCEGQACGGNGLVCQSGSCLCPGGDVESNCGDGLDDDCDGNVDCADPDCASSTDCAGVEVQCGDGQDNDGDGTTDCADSDCGDQACGPNGMVCQGSSCQCPGGSMETNCSDGQDNDCDGSTDCGDGDCSSNPACVNAETDCSNNIDDDNDGNTDCLDADCANQPCGANGLQCLSGVCQCAGGQTEVACTDFSDNDCDGMTDCDDSDCSMNPACREGNCTDGLDNDGDGQADCLDSDCNGQACGPNGLVCQGTSCQCPGGSTESSCSDGTDNDCDGDIDCDDSDCAADSACRESNCLDGLDNDGDGQADCLDSDCAGQTCGPNGLVCQGMSCECPGGSTESSCSDGVDNDCDGSTDCNDGDCTNDPNCAGGTCSAQSLILCWNMLDGTTADATNAVSTYSCSGLNEAGPDEFHLFFTSTNMSVTAALSNLSADLDLFVLDGTSGQCDPTNCVADSINAGTADESVTLNPSGAAFYYFAVDAMSASSAYHLETQCTGGTGCSANFAVDCGATDSYQTGLASSTDNISSYASPCPTWTEDGPEYTYLFMPSSGSSATIDLTCTSGDDLDLFVLRWNGGSCDGDFCAAGGAEFGDESVTFTYNPGDIFFVVVDGYNGASGSYDIRFTCH